jgi:ribosomal-protein-alanine N-acetyltransferase
VSTPPAFIIETDRTLMIPTPSVALERRAAMEEFEIDLDVGGAPVPVRVPAGWPGDDLDGLPDLLALRASDHSEPWNAMVIDRVSLEAVGQIGCTALPDHDGRVEVRYATLRDRRDRGFATEAGGAFVDWLLARPGVRPSSPSATSTTPPRCACWRRPGSSRSTSARTKMVGCCAGSSSVPPPEARSGREPPRPDHLADRARVGRSHQVIALTVPTALCA